MLKKAAEWYEFELKSIKIYLTKEEPKERILSHKEIRLLIDNSDPPLKYIILVALNTGMRKGEIYKLEWSNVSLKQSFITIAAPTAKSKKIRRIPLNKSLRKLFIKLSLNRNGNQFVFENPETGKAYFDLKKGWYSLLRSYGIKDLRFHDLRHTYASNYLMKGGDIYTLKEILGHEDISTTARYLTIPSDHKRKSMEIFDVPENESNVIDIKEVINRK
jgi:integrase